LTWQQEVFWYRLLVQCDDYGRMDARLAILRARCFPLRVDRVSAKDIEGYLKCLQDIGLIQLYVVEDKPFLAITKWEKHQQIRAQRAKYPGLDDVSAIIDNHLITDDINGNQMIADALVIQTNPNLNLNPNIESNKLIFSDFKNVHLTQEEYDKLVESFGEPVAKDKIEALSLYKKSKGKQYKDDYATILVWARTKKAEKSEGDGRHPDKFVKGKYGHLVER
jgi:hypothetical protein